MADDVSIQPGDSGELVQLSPCLGGLVRTWTDSGESQLWSVSQSQWLLGAQGTGSIARTPREDRRFREVAWLSGEEHRLTVQWRFPTETDDGEVTLDANVVSLELAGRPADDPFEDLRELLGRAIGHCIDKNEFLVVEKGGWDPPDEPFCLFLLVNEEEGLVSVVETAPPPHGSEVWAANIAPGREATTLSAPASPGTIEVAPLLMMEAMSTWGVEPWDLALTFGER